jgi:hypothetical protein
VKRIRKPHRAHRLCLLGVAFGAGAALTTAAITSVPGDTSIDARGTTSLTWSTEAIGPRRFIGVHGYRSAIFGYSQNGLEVWAYPVQILSSYSAAFLQRGATREIDGQAILRRIEYRPESIVRVYVGPDFVVREKLFVPLDAPGALVSYETEGARPVDVVIRFVPVLDLMWPAATGGQETGWDTASSEYLLTEVSEKYAALVGSPDMVAHDDTVNPALPAVRSPELSFRIRPPQDGRAARVVIAGGGSPQETAGHSRINSSPQEWNSKGPQSLTTSTWPTLPRGLRLRTQTSTAHCCGPRWP